MKIAIVNDLESSIYRLRFIVEREPGWEVVWQAKNGVEAVEQCANNVPDLILMDLLMPVMNGAQATKIIRKYEEENSIDPCYIAAVTAYSEYTDNYKEHGLDSVILKPVTKKELYIDEDSEE